MKRKLLIMTALCLTILACLAFSFTASAEEAAPTVSIEKFNLAFEDNTYIKYAVKFTGIDDEKITENNIGMLYWKDTADGFVPGTEDFSSETTGYTTISGEKYYVFKYTNMVAKQLADYVYSVAYLEYDGETYYSAPVKFSALEYCYSKLGKTGEASENADFRNLLTATLEQGAAAQKYFKYNTDRLANAEYYQINLVGGKLDDGFTSGLFLSTDKVTITAPETSGDLVFAGWQNSAGEIAFTTNVATVENMSKNETYTATYEEAVKYSEGFVFISNGNGTCDIDSSRGCKDEYVVIPPTSPEGDIVVSIGKIGSFVFGNNAELRENMKSVTIPDTVSYIHDGVFWGCGSLTEIIVSESNPYFSTINGSLYNKSATTLLRYVPTADAGAIIPKSVTKIYNYAFDESVSIDKIFYCGSSTEWSKVSKPSDVTSKTIYYYSEIAPTTEGSFWHCNENGEIEVWPAYVAPKYSEGLAFTSNGDGTCSVSGIGTCTDTDVVIPPESPEGWSVTSIGSYSFEYCTSLTSITIPDSVTSISLYAFYNCTSLESVTIGNSVTRIGSYAFYNCTSLTSITIPDSVTSIGESAFLGCTSLENIEVDNNNTYCKSVDGVLYTKDGKTLICYPAGKSGEIFIIPDSVTSIGSSAFEDCTSLTSVTIGDSVTSIGRSAFSGCTSLTSITIPNSVTSIGDYAFYGCRSLTIYCEAASKPDGWNSNWNYSYPDYIPPVIWGYTGE